jgi:hypothetical protein
MYEIQLVTLFTLATSFKSPRILHYSKESRKTDLIELWSDMLLETLVANPSKLHFGQGLLHGDLKDCTMVWVTGTHHIPISKEIWNLQ